MMKTPFKIIICIVSSFIASASFGQSLSDQQIGFNVEKITQCLSEKGATASEINDYIAKSRALHQDLYKKNQEQMQKGLPSTLMVSNRAISTAIIPTSEKNALIAIYNATKGTVAGSTTWLNHFGWDNPTSDVAGWDAYHPLVQNGWYGVTLNANGNVISLRLPGNGLNGVLPNLQNLPNLQEILIGGNPNLTGNVTVFQQLDDLGYLDIAYSNFSGDIQTIATLEDLYNFSSGGNQLTGDLSVLGGLTNLARLSLYGPNLFSNVKIPSSFSQLVNLQILELPSLNFSDNSDLVLIGQNLHNLTYLNLVDNHYSGALPVQFQQLTNLKSLYISSNHAITNIDNISNCHLLEVIGANINQITANPQLFLNFPNLNTLNMDQNLLTSFPDLSNSHLMQMLSLEHNLITGASPSYFQNLPQLYYLQLQSNHITTFPNISNSPLMNTLLLDMNDMSGQIPAYLHNYNSLALIGWAYNKFRFIDFADYFNFYISRNLTYTPQAKTDTATTVSKIVGSSVTFTMYEDGRFLPNASFPTLGNDTYQWFKDGVAITGTNANRTYTIASVAATDAGVYTCSSNHNINPAMTNLTLERNPITLTVASTPSGLGPCPEGFEGSVFPPAGWTVFDNGIATTQSWSAYNVVLTPPRVYNGVNSASARHEYVAPGTFSKDYLVTPITTITANSVLRFYTRPAYNGDRGDKFQIKVKLASSGPPTDPTGYVTVQDWTSLTMMNGASFSVFLEKKVNLSAFVGQYYIAFVKESTFPNGGGTANDWFIDDVSLVNNCQDPISPLSYTPVTQTSGTIAWGNNAGASQFQVEYGPAGFVLGTGTTITTNANSCLITGLTQNGNYAFYVKRLCAECSIENNSNYVGPFSFTSALYCNAPNGLTVSNYTGTSATLTWDASGATSWEVWAIPENNIPPTPQTAGIIVNTPTYNLTNLVSSVRYNFYIRTLCGPGNISEIIHTPVNGESNEVCTRKNIENTNMIKQLFVFLMNDLIAIVNANGTVPPAYNPAQLQALAPYISDSNPRIYNFSYTNNVIKFSFSDHGLSVLQDVEIPYTQSYGTMDQIDIGAFFSPFYHIYNANVSFQHNNTTGILSHIDFCKVVTPGESCTKKNPLTSIVKAKFIDLVNYLHQMLTTGVNIPSGYNCPQLDALRPYLTDPNARIYNINAEPFSFSFHPNGPGEKFDVYIYEWPLSGSLNVTDIDLSPYVNALTYTTLDDLVTINGINNPKSVYVRHVNFCPPQTIEPDCEVHFDFNFKVPSKNKGGLFTIQQKENIANGIVQFINTKLGQDLYISTFDDYYGGNVRRTVLQTKFLAPLPLAIPNNPETYVTGLLRIQDDNYTNTFQHFITAANGIVGNPLITKQIDIAFFVLSNDKYTNINDAKAAYDALLASTIVENGVTKPRVKKVFFIVFDQGSFTKAGVPPLNSVDFITALKGGIAPIDFNSVGSVFNSDYIQYANDQVISNDFPNRLNEFLQRAYEVAKKDCSAESCINSNPRSYTVKVKFLELVNQLHEIANNGGSIPNGFNCAELIALKPYLTDKNPRIYNFRQSPFSFSFHEVRKENEHDVLIDRWDYTGDATVATVNDINILSYTDSSVFTNLDGKVTLSNGLIPKQTEVRHVNFCPGEGEISCTVDNENSEIVSEHFIDLVQYLMNQKLSGLSDGDINSNINAVSPIALNNLRPFLTDFNSGVYNFVSTYSGDTLVGMQFSFSKEHEVDVQMYGDFLEVANLDLTLDLSSYTNSNDYIDLSGDYSDQSEDDKKIIFSKFIIRHINFCPPSVLSCTATNPRSARVKSLFINLVNRLKSEFETNGTIPDGFGAGVPELTLLTPYITDQNPLIYNFVKEPFSFSFHPINKEGSYDVLIAKGPISNSSNVATISSMTTYTDALQYTDLSGLMTLANGYQPDDVQVRHINFCPDKYCVNHIAIVLDESGSLTDLEKTKIRRQLKNFVKQQAQFNNDTGGEMHVSLIGMSDRDSDGGRHDHILEELVTTTSVQDSPPGLFIDWINNYGNRYHLDNPAQQISGVSEGSDYWNSGLRVALNSTLPPELVIMITDGSQSADITGLAQTMREFENSTYGGQPKDASKPHLYVIGIDNGSYVYGEPSVPLPREQDPNYNHNLTSSNTSVQNRTLSSSLALSLKYLLQLENATFPTPDPKHFMAPPNFTTPNPDYYGYDSFAELGEDPTYLSDRIKRADIGCGKEAIKNPCDDCISFQPEAGKQYVINAWAKEELNAQVENYDNPKIEVIFKDINEHIVGNEEFGTKGDIIDGWQRIIGRFDVPEIDPLHLDEKVVFVEVKLINKSKSAPVFFDDVRIYPITGSMKTFVYDPETFRLMSELDENNYSTYYEYDNEGGLVRIKKETSEGIKTIQETRSGNYIKRD